MTAPAEHLPPETVRAVRDALAGEAVRDYARDALAETVRVDTLSTPDLADTAAREQQVLGSIERRARALDTASAIRRVPILPEIDRYKEYTIPSYARREDGAVPPAAEVYAGRYNLIVTVPGADTTGRGLAVNAHVDVVAPYFAFSEHDGRLWGRGVVDDKGQCVAMLVAMKALGEQRRVTRALPPREVTLQFVIDEEMGGNGSLSVAADKSVRFGCVCVCEATQMTVHPANRGAVWYRIELETTRQTGLSAALLAGRVLLELRAEGERIKAESNHPLFPDRPVQTCNGVMGGWGPHPSRVSPMVGLCVARPEDCGDAVWDEMAAAIDAAVRRGVTSYCERYGDATRQPDPDDASRPKVVRHFDVLPRDDYIAVCLYGKAGHMGKIDELDCAATKAAHVMAELEQALGGQGGIFLAEGPPQEQQTAPIEPESTVVFRGPDEGSLRRVVMEGGQGFVPTHKIDDVQVRIARAAERAAAAYCEERGFPSDTVKVTSTFDRLHNNAFERPADSPAMAAALAALKLADLDKGEPVRGWEVSCDARLFADLRPDVDVITFGPGDLRYAHSDEESITVEEILKGAEFLVYLALLYGRQ